MKYKCTYSGWLLSIHGMYSSLAQFWTSKDCEESLDAFPEKKYELFLPDDVDSIKTVSTLSNQSWKKIKGSNIHLQND